MNPVYAAVDLGAESGRVLACEIERDALRVTEAHRFPNRPVRLLGTLHWNVLDLHQSIVDGLRKIAADGRRIKSVAVDTWGIDYGLIGSSGQLVGNPVHYRDARAVGAMEEALAEVERREIFWETGIQFMPINTIYHLYAAVKRNPEQIRAAESLLMMGELFTYFLSGEKFAEVTNASTSQLFNPTTRAWSHRIGEKLGLPMHLFPELKEPGQIIGELLPEVAEAVGAEGVSVVLPAVHDTASAVAAVPARSQAGGRWGYISSGTWSLAGIELSSPCINDDALRYNFTNEVGACGTIRFLKNVMGLWLIQQCRETWRRSGEELSYEEIAALAAATKGAPAVVDPDHSAFLPPGDMPARIREYCEATGQKAPESVGETALCVFTSLALKYRYVFEKIAATTGYDVDVIHIVGGGARNRLLNQMTADATGKPVIAGPYEGTAIGNALMQLLAHGEIKGLDEGRRLVRNSVSCTEFEPAAKGSLDEAYARLVQMIEST